MALYWQKTSDDCEAPDCYCQEPSEAPQYAGQIAHTPCGPVGTGDYVCVGYVIYQWQCAGGNCVWGAIEYACEPSDGFGICGGQPPQRNGAYPNEVAYGTCVKM